MKDFIAAVAVFMVLLLIIPTIVVGAAFDVNKQSTLNASSTGVRQAGKSAALPDDVVFKIRDAKTGAQQNVGGYELICGIVAGEMPSEYDSEALKAQAVSAFSYCMYIRENTKDGVCVTGKDVAYLPENSAKKLWGGDFEKQWAKIDAAVRAVYGKALFYDGRIIEANYFDMSSGCTENNNDVFGNFEPYLVEVKSPGDCLEKGFKTQVKFSLKEFESRVKAFDSKTVFGKDPSHFIEIKKRSGAGGILEAALCGKKVTGRQIRSLFDLRSANFTFAYNGGKDPSFTFVVLGYGHGVGMSQCGAQYMAKQGKNWRDIVTYYYKGAQIGDYLVSGGLKLADIKK